MDYVKGQTLEQLLVASGGRLPLERAVRIVLQAAEGLEHAHGKGVLHRDIKPSNILVSSQEEQDRVSLFDFGIAQDVGADSESVTGEDIPGSLLYITPEQLSRQTSTRQSDIYQLGLVLFEALTGRLPFEISVSAALAYRRESGPVLPEDGQLGNIDLSEGIRAMLKAALCRDPLGRPGSMGLFAYELREVLRKRRVVALRPETRIETISA